jgi:hypothetical protein
MRSAHDGDLVVRRSSSKCNLADRVLSQLFSRAAQLHRLPTIVRVVANRQRSGLLHGLLNEEQTPFLGHSL